MGLNDIGNTIWASKYAAYKGETYEQGCKRVVDLTYGYFTGREQRELYRALSELKFSPGGRVWFSAGKPKPQFANCALFDVEDNKQSWGEQLKNVAISLMSGNGIGIEVSKIRPKGSKIYGSGGTASGALSFVQMINEAARHIMQGNTHRSACHSAIHWKHKDVYDWLTIKQWDENYTRMKEISYDYGAPLDMFNISIRYDTEFITSYTQTEHRDHSYAVALWDKHIRTMFEYADPSIQFDADDQILRNACSEIISNKNFDQCHLGQINLAHIKDNTELYEIAKLAGKFTMILKYLDTYAIPEMKDIGTQYPRLGIGVMGMHNWLLERGYSYGWNKELETMFSVYRAGAVEGAFEASREYGFAYPVAVTSQAPTGSVSRLQNGVSGGIESIFSAAYLWRFQAKGERVEQITIDPYVLSLVQQGKLDPSEPFADALSLATPEGFKRRVDMQVNIQRYTDNAISSTINLPAWGTTGNNEQTLDYYKQVIFEALPKLRGITVYPDGARGGQPLTSIPLVDALRHKGYTLDTSYSNCSSGLCAT